eukprot:scaffold12665_cov69-Phaeocystis_antarctica.AAC.3
MGSLPDVPRGSIGSLRLSTSAASRARLASASRSRRAAVITSRARLSSSSRIRRFASSAASSSASSCAPATAHSTRCPFTPPRDEMASRAFMHVDLRNADGSPNGGWSWASSFSCIIAASRSGASALTSWFDAAAASSAKVAISLTHGVSVRRLTDSCCLSQSSARDFTWLTSTRHPLAATKSRRGWRRCCATRLSTSRPRCAPVSCAHACPTQCSASRPGATVARSSENDSKARSANLRSSTAWSAIGSSSSDSSRSSSSSSSAMLHSRVRGPIAALTCAATAPGRC